MKRVSWFVMVLSLVFWLGATCYAEQGEEAGVYSVNTPIETAIVGIWQIAGQPVFISVNVNGMYAIGIMYGAGEGYIVGTLAGNTCSIYDGSGLSRLDATLTLTSDITGIFKINQCVALPGYHCLLPAGATVNVQKVF